MSFTSYLKHLRIDSASVIPNPHTQVVVGIFKLELDAFCPRMRKGVDQCFSTDPVKLMPYGQPQGLLSSGDHTKVNIRVNP